MLRRTAMALALVAVATAAVWPTGTSADVGIHNIQHVVVIMQENRSFDSYFGTYPGAMGIPSGVCVPDPANGGCQAPYHNPSDVNYGGPHGSGSAKADIDNGNMDGFIATREQAAQCSPTST